MAVNTEFYHHGVKGQKWGVRRYRNANGSLTPAGKQRAKMLNAKIDKEYERHQKGVNRRLEKSKKLASTGNVKDKLKSDYVRDVANHLSRYNSKLRDLKRSEVKTGSDYLEHRLAEREWAGLTVGMIAGAGVGFRAGGHAGLTAVRMVDRHQYPEQYEARKSLGREHKRNIKTSKAAYKSKRKAWKAIEKERKKRKGVITDYKPPKDYERSKRRNGKEIFR